MTESEAIEAIQFDLKIGGEIHSQVLLDAIDVAIQALEMVQKLSDRKMTTGVLENYMQFEDECVKKGFTFKSVIEAREKQIPKRAYHISPVDDNDNANVECPECHATTDYAVNVIKRGHCWKCGQLLDWSDGNDD